MRSRDPIDLSENWLGWRNCEPIDVRRPERDWQGALGPVEASHRSSVDRPVNQLRDPFLFVEQDAAYLVYAVAGESGLAIARLEVQTVV